jgi:hypothetical protein
MIPERPNDAAGGDMREDELLFELAKLGGSPLFFCKCSLQRILSPMFWKCSFQRVYKRVCGSADSKGFSDWRRDWWIFHAERNCAVSLLQPAPSKFPTTRHDFSILPPTPRFRPGWQNKPGVSNYIARALSSNSLGSSGLKQFDSGFSSTRPSPPGP